MAITPVLQNDLLDTWRTTLNINIARWNALGESPAIVITGGNIDGAEIGGTTPAVGTFTNLTVSSTIDVSAATLIISDNAISGDKISGGTIECDNVDIQLDPSIGNHATRKSYVDAQIVIVQDDIIALSIALG